MTADKTLAAVWQRATGKHLRTLELAPIGLCDVPRAAVKLALLDCCNDLHLVLTAPEDWSTDWRAPAWAPDVDPIAHPELVPGGKGTWHVVFDLASTAAMSKEVVTCARLSGGDAAGYVDGLFTMSSTRGHEQLILATHDRLLSAQPRFHALDPSSYLWTASQDCRECFGYLHKIVSGGAGMLCSRVIFNYDPNDFTHVHELALYSRKLDLGRREHVLWSHKLPPGGRPDVIQWSALSEWLVVASILTHDPTEKETPHEKVMAWDLTEAAVARLKDLSSWP